MLLGAGDEGPSRLRSRPWNAETSSPSVPACPSVCSQICAERLAGTRWPDPVAGVGWSEGVDQAWLRRVVTYWESRFDWRVHEARLNALPQFLVRVGDTRVHCVHMKGRGSKPMPLIITHGWPGSVFEMLRIVPMLADPLAHGGSAQDAFDVVVPSIPGYGFSERPTAPGMSNSAVADVWIELMERLGYVAVRGAGRRLGRGDLDLDRAEGARAAPRAAPQLHPGLVPAVGGEPDVVERRGARLPRRRGTVVRGGGGIRARPGDAPGHARHRAQRFARGARGVDPGKDSGPGPTATRTSSHGFRSTNCWRT